MAWVLKNKLKNEIKTVDAKSESTLVGSKIGKKEASPRPHSRQSSATPIKKTSNGSYLSSRSEQNETSKQQWKINSHSSSNSELSAAKK